MPGGDGTGPAGMGPITERVAGYRIRYPIPGWGRGFGRRGGRGMSRGISQGRVLEKGLDRGARQAPPPGNPGVQPQMTREEEIASLREQARDLERRIRDMARRIDQVQKGKVHAVAHVDAQQCKGCGMCVDFCPVRAIAVNDVAIIDARKCIGCGACVDECPFGAISMNRQ
jgi:ferredoxin